MSVNLSDQSVQLWHIITDSKTPSLHQWCFPAANIKAVSSAKRDERAVFFYVYQNSDDFMLFFPSDNHRRRYGKCTDFSSSVLSCRKHISFRFLQLTEEITAEIKEAGRLLDEYDNSATLEVKRAVFFCKSDLLTALYFSGNTNMTTKVNELFSEKEHTVLSTLVEI